MNRLQLVFMVAVVALLATGTARPGNVQATPPVEAYCCLCADCLSGGCVLVDVMANGYGNPEHTCPTFCPEDCHGSLQVEGACAEHTAAECPVTERAPALSPWAVALCVAALGAYGMRRVRRSQRPGR